ncbi:hypothetical protein [Haloarchaeobius sp. DT45]
MSEHPRDEDGNRRGQREEDQFHHRPARPPLTTSTLYRRELIDETTSI